QLADALLAAQDLGERAGRPAAARQLGIKDWEAGGSRRGAELRRSAEPDRLPLQDLFEGCHDPEDTVCLYSMEALAGPSLPDYPFSGLPNRSRKSTSSRSLRSGIEAWPRIHASTRCTGDLSAIASSSMPATASALLNKSCLVVTAREFIGLPTRRHHPIGLTPSFDAAELRLIGAHEVAAEHLVEVVLRVPRQLVLLHHEH